MKCVTCGDIQTVSHIIDSCFLTKLYSSVQCLHTADCWSKTT